MGTLLWWCQLLLLSATWLQILPGTQAAGDCQLPDHGQKMRDTLESCRKKHGNNLLCWFMCITVDMEMVKEDGKPNQKKIREAMDDLPDGVLKDTMKLATKKCLKKGTKIDMKKANCMGIMKLGMCIKSELDKTCSGVMD